MKALQFRVEHQDPLSSARALLQDLWHTASLEGFYIPIWPEQAEAPQGGICDEPSQLTLADPFAPVMPMNQAPQAYQALHDHPGRRWGLFLRPCEWRTFKTLVDRSGEPGGALVLAMSADCTGTMAPQDFVARGAGDMHALTREALHFASQGGILPSRRQSSCQLCEDPFPRDVDLQFELFGIPTEQYLVISFRDADVARVMAERAHGTTLPTSMVERRKLVLRDLARWRASSFEKRKAALDPEKSTIEALASHLHACEVCRETLKRHCPLLDLDLLSQVLARDLAAAQAWLGSCSGCGVCELDCPEAYPLFDVIFSLRGVH